MLAVTIKKAIHACCPSFLEQTLARIETSEIGYRIAKGAFWSLAGAVISRALMLVASIVVARILGKTGFGELGIIQATVGMFGVFAGFGLGLTATKHVAEFRQSDPERAGRIIGLSGLVAMATGGLMALGLLIFAPWLAEHTINAPHLTGTLRIAALILFISALNGAQTGALSGFEAFRTIAYVNFFVGVISFPILVLGTYLGGLTGAVWALAINLCFNWLLNHLALRKEARRYSVPFTLRNCSLELPVLWRFSLPAALSGILVAPVNWACGALLVNQTNGYSEMGVFNAAKQWQLAILFIPGILGQVLLPLLSNLNSESEESHYRETLKYNLFLNASIAFIIVAPLLFMAKFIMSSYGVGFENGFNVFKVLALTAVLISLNNIVGQAIASQSKMWTGFIFNAMWAMALLSATWIFINNGFGAMGLAYAMFIAYTLHTLWQGIYLIKLLSKD